MYSQILTQGKKQYVGSHRDLSLKISSFKKCICGRSHCYLCLKNKKLSRYINSQLNTFSSEEIDSVASTLLKYRTQLICILSQGCFNITARIFKVMKYLELKKTMPHWYQTVTYDTYMELASLCSNVRYGKITPEELYSRLVELSLPISPRLLNCMYGVLELDCILDRLSYKPNAVSWYISATDTQYKKYLSEKFLRFYQRLHLKKTLESHITEVGIIHMIYAYLGC